MARIPAIEPQAHPESGKLISEIQGQRGRLSPLYATLLHSPPLAAGWLHFLTAVRREGALEARYRELAVLRVSQLNRAYYGFESHRSHAIAAGISEAQVAALDIWPQAQLFSEREHAVLAYTDAMTRDVEVADPIFETLRRLFGHREIVELTAIVAAYNLVSRFLVALKIGVL